jgi:phosphatidylethanolamine/phosphatidyl-N-methylethanolamine N-methyltransferase
VKPIAVPSNLLFLRSLLLNPKSIGALAPSSPKLSRFIAARVGSSRAPVLEIGAGTGAITRELLQNAIDPANLFVIERDARLAWFLRQKFPGVLVRCDDALHCGRILSEHAVPSVRTVVSSLPLRNMEPDQRNAIVEAMLNTLDRNGQLIQYTYAPVCPIPARQFDLTAECLGRIWTNLPPATVWRFVKRAAVRSQAGLCASGLTSRPPAQQF